MLEEFREMLEDHDRDDMPNVLFAAAECAPLAKTGGLADVVGTLPGALRPFGVDARVIIPYHRVIKEKYSGSVQHMFHFFVDLGWRHQYAGIEKLEINDTVIYLVDSEMYFGGPIYRGGMAEIEQYAFFVRAVLEAIPRLDFVPEIVHCNDWHTAMIPMLARTQYCGRIQEKIKYLLSIHNIAFQGWCSFELCSDLLGVNPAYYTPEFVELNGCADFLKAGCVFSDRINTVSPSYAGEIKSAYYGENLEGILNARSAQLCGILNGIDTKTFDPEHEKNLPANFSVKDMSGKAVCKSALQEKMGLRQDPDVPILSMVMRMTEQKGFELVMEQLDDIMSKEKLQFVLLGSGDARYEDFMRGAQARYPGRLGIFLGYNEELAHLVYAGSDLFLMPSRFEPCGLSQMIAMRYGCLPIVRETGGLKDSVIPYNCFTNEGDGFSFTNFDSGEMRMVISYAINTYHNKKAYSGLVRRAMEKDFSFEHSAKEYVRLYINMLDGYHETLPVLFHDCRSKKNRDPFGAVPCGNEVRLSFDVLTGKVENACLILLGNALENGRTEYQMKKLKGRFSITVKTPALPCALKYFFRVETKYGSRFFCADRTGLSGALYGGEGEGFRLTVYRPDVETPEWFRRSVMYQIFPDRFGFYGKAVAKRGVKYHKSLGRNIILHSDTSEPVKWESSEEAEYVPDDFYGGTFAGISRKLPYLKRLGITCIYLNPICESASNHRYDTADYMKPDPVLGTEKDFAALCRKADGLGIKIILDGVFPYTGADSRYFNKYARYEGEGAYQSESSDCACWYTFEKFPDKYSCWHDFMELPKVNMYDPKWQQFIFAGENSVIKVWMRLGVSGWRINVADGIPDEVLASIRKEIKNEDPDAPLIGEMWEDCVGREKPDGSRDYTLGNSLDSVMNYPFRFALIDFIMHRRNAWSFSEFLISQQMNYPRPLYYSLMNIVSSHDVARIRTALASDVNLHDLPRGELSEMVFDGERLNKALELEKLAAIIQFIVPGVPCIYYGDEQGMTGQCDPLNRAPFQEADSRELYDFYAELAEKRNTCEAILSGEASFVAVSDDVLAVLRYLPEGSAVCAVINCGEKSEKYSLNFNKEGFGKVRGKIAARSAVIIDL